MGLSVENSNRGPNIHIRIPRTSVQPNPNFWTLTIRSPRGLILYPSDYTFAKNNRPCIFSNLNHYHTSNELGKKVQSIKTLSSNRKGMFQSAFPQLQLTMLQFSKNVFLILTSLQPYLSCSADIQKYDAQRTKKQLIAPYRTQGTVFIWASEAVLVLI